MYWPPRGSPASHISSAKINAVQGSASRPPQRSGQWGTNKPALASAPQNFFENVLCTSEPGPCASDSQSLGRLAAKKSRTVERNVCCSRSQLKSITFDPPPRAQKFAQPDSTVTLSRQ